MKTRYLFNKWLSLRLIATLVIFVTAITVIALRVINSKRSKLRPDGLSAFPAASKARMTLSAKSPDQTLAEDYAVYSAALSDSRYIDSSVHLVVIRDRTFRYPSSPHREIETRHLIEAMPELEGDTLNDYLVRNEDEQQLNNLFNLKVKSALVSGREIDALLKNNFIEGWQVIKNKYPDTNGIITLSRVGFNRQRTEALIYLSISCGPHCGEGSFILLRKTNNVWSIWSKLMMNVS